MNMLPTITTLRSSVAYQFSTLRMRARRAQLWSKLIGNDSALIVFPGGEQRVSPNRRLVGIKDIRVDQIVGTLNRTADFDSQFRPLKKHNQDRWVNAYILRKQDGWSPIIVHKVGGQYFVEDGHHRVSVARATGMDFIEASVWEYAVQEGRTGTCHPAKCAERKPIKAYVSG